MSTLEIVKLISIIAGFVVTTAIPFIVALVNQIKAKRAAKTEAEKEAAKNLIIEVIKNGVVEAEELYKDINSILKSQGKSAGAVKKDSVLTKVQAFALEKGIEFDANFVNAQIDNIVALTRQVNSK